MSDEIDMVLLEATEKMDKAIEVAREDFATIRRPLKSSNGLAIEGELASLTAIELDHVKVT